MEQVLAQFNQNVRDLERPHRRALSSSLPRIAPVLIFIRAQRRNFQNILDRRITTKRSEAFFPLVIARHQSLLLRTLGNSDIRLQQQKITNLKLAAAKLNGLVLQPGEVFSFWKSVGRPRVKVGYVNGMLLADGMVREGLGGGLCQMSNLLCWLFLHAHVELVERHHHAFDAFPDSGRVLPFGSGATVFYNYIDLKIQNTSPFPIQLKVWLTDKHLKGQIVAPQTPPTKFHLEQKNHFFVRHGRKVYRTNEIWRKEVHADSGSHVGLQKVSTNFAPVMYPVDQNYLQRSGADCIDLPSAD